MNYKKFLGAASAALMLVIIVILVLAPCASAGGKYKTLYEFTGGKDANDPLASLIFDEAGNLYGTTMDGGSYGLGAVFKLTANVDGTWTERVLYSFTGGADGQWPLAGLIFDAAGNLYGTNAVDTVFELAPNADGTWTESVLHRFSGPDGAQPKAGMIFDQAGNLYGTTFAGGGNKSGTVFKLTPNDDGSWTEDVLHNFCSRPNCVDGAYSTAGLILDTKGNLYGTTEYGGKRGSCSPTISGCGVVFRLSPNGNGSWTETVLHHFSGGKDGGDSVAGLVLDGAGNLYGTTEQGGNLNDCSGTGCGVVFRLTPNADGSWAEDVLHHFTGGDYGWPIPTGLTLDQEGNLYGATLEGGSHRCGNGYGCGVVFKLVRNSYGIWHETVLHNFQDHPGAYPQANLIFDAAGNLFGTTAGDGTTTFGSVFEITP